MRLPNIYLRFMFYVILLIFQNIDFSFLEIQAFGGEGDCWG